jgi:hypothetical protein
MRKSDQPVEALDAKGSFSESASVQTTMKIERRVSLEKPNVPVETVGAESKTEVRKRRERKKHLSGRTGVVAVVCAQRIEVSTREIRRSAMAQAKATGDPRGSEPGYVRSRKGPQ